MMRMTRREYLAAAAAALAALASPAATAADEGYPILEGCGPFETEPYKIWPSIMPWNSAYTRAIESSGARLVCSGRYGWSVGAGVMVAGSRSPSMWMLHAPLTIYFMDTPRGLRPLCRDFYAYEVGSDGRDARGVDIPAMGSISVPRLGLLGGVHISSVRVKRCSDTGRMIVAAAQLNGAGMALMDERSGAPGYGGA